MPGLPLAPGRERGSAEAGPEWKLLQIAGRADKGYGPAIWRGAALHSARQTVDGRARSRSSTTE
ncbi:MAG: hypothetical protein WDN24_21715 [Sphingomonas sp.]